MGSRPVCGMALNEHLLTAAVHEPVNWPHFLLICREGSYTYKLIVLEAHGVRIFATAKGIIMDLKRNIGIWCRWTVQHLPVYKQLCDFLADHTRHKVGGVNVLNTTGQHYLTLAIQSFP